MGAGNFFFSKNIKESRMVYVDYCESYDNQFESELQWEELKQEIVNLIPNSFNIHCESDSYRWTGEGELVAYNNLVNILIKDLDGCRAAVAVVIEDDSEYANLAYHHIDNYADKLFDKLSEYYNLRVRACAWTSSAYIPTTECEVRYG
jgi:hypothetical protein